MNRPTGHQSALEKRTLRAFISIALLACTPLVSAGEPEPPSIELGEENVYSERIESAKTVKALDSGLFGDVISLQNGALSFSVTDVELPGNNALPVRITREYAVRDTRNDPNTNHSFRDWRLALPRVYGVFSEEWNAQSSGGGNPTLNRCSSGTGPTITENAQYFLRESIFNGVNLEIPGGPSGEILWTAPGVTKPAAVGNQPYRWTLDGQTHLRCLSSLQSNAGGEGFVAITPDGTQYSFDRMARRQLPALRGPVLDGQIPGGIASINRWEISLYVTRVEDRFGNWVVYNYSNAPSAGVKLDSIQSSDGRSITLQYDTQLRIQTIRAGQVPGVTPPVARQWQYLYSGATGLLHKVRLPATNGSWTQGIDQEWTYDLTALSNALIDTTGPGDDSSCLIPRTPANHNAVFVGSIVHPTGATAQYTVAIELHGRSGVIENCRNFTMVGSNPNTNDPADDVAIYPMHYYLLTLKQKRITGPGLAAQNWVYSYERDKLESYRLGPNPEIPLCPFSGPDPTLDPCRRPPCTSDNCAKRSYTKVVRPNGSIEKHTFGNTWRHNEGKLLGVEIFENEVDYAAVPPRPLRRTEYRYDIYQDRPQGFYGYPEVYGTSLQDWFQGFASEYHRPSIGLITEQQGVTFQNLPQIGRTTFVDHLARPLSWVRSSTGFRTEQITYHDNTSKWVLGQTQSIVVDGVETYRAVFDPIYALKTEVYLGGELRQQLDYRLPNEPSAQLPGQLGTLESVTDGRNKQTGYSEWKRGVPGTITYHDQTSVLTSVDDNGWPTSRRDERLHNTVYRYDGLGRLREIDHDGPWASTLLTMTRLPAFGAPFGLDAHWRRSVEVGNQRTDTYLDALYRTVRVDTVDTSPQNAAASRSVLSRYDSVNRKIFESYPLASLGMPTGAEKGTHWLYDALGRETQQIQDTEIGTHPTAVTTTEYLSGFRKRIVNPKGKITELDLMAFGDPDQAWPTRVYAPHAQTTDLVRDTHGNPTSISRTSTYGGVQTTLTRQYVYDASQRLCKRIEPESGVSIFKYDGASNLEWSAHGLKVADFGQAGDCSYTQVPAAEKILRSYDNRNRLTEIDYQDAATPNVEYEYYADGTVMRAERGNFRWNFSYNELKLRETETLTDISSGTSWLFDPTYRADGALESLAYPGQSSAPTQFNPNGFGEPTQVGAVAAGVSYHADGSVASVTYANGTVYTRTVNDRFLPNSMSYVRSGTNIYTSGMIYDRNGNLESVTGTLPNSYGYDDLDRLTSANGWQFTYDELDNLRRSVTTGRMLDFDVTDGRMMAVRLGGNPLLTYDYDSRGNMSSSRVASIPGTTYPVVFDRADMVRSHSSPEVDESYQYDAYGHRTFKRSVEGGITTDSTQVHTPDGLLRWDRTGNVTKRYYYLGRQLIAHTVENGATEWYVTDHLGSNVARWSASASLDTSRFSPFGERVGLPEAYGAEVGPGYAGHYEDSTALTYMKARYYSAVTGRFLSPDPVGVDPMTGANFNRYWYANNNPMKFVDPDGRESACFSLGTGCGLSGSTAASSVAIFAGRQAVDSGSERARYATESGRLSPDDSAGRAALKSDSRARTPSMTRASIAAARPSTDAKPGSGGRANVANATANAAGAALKGAGTALLVAGVVVQVNEIASSGDPAKDLAGAGGMTLGAIALGEAGAAGGAWAGALIGGPFGAAVGAVVGGVGGAVAGGAAGEAAGEKLYEQSRR